MEVGRGPGPGDHLEDRPLVRREGVSIPDLDDLPAALVSGIISERGIAAANELRQWQS